MKKTRKRTFTCVIILIALVAMIVHSQTDYAYARRLEKAIVRGDRAAIQQIVSKKPTCVNKLTTSLPRGIYVLLFDYNPVYPLVTACRKGQIDIITYLIDNGADVNCNDGCTPLSVTYTVKNDNWFETSKYLISKGASLDYQTSYCRNAAVFCDILDRRPGVLVEGYVAENADEVMAAFWYAFDHADLSQINWNRVLKFAAVENRNEVVTFLIEQNMCNVNDITFGTTPLMEVARNRWQGTNMVTLLLSLGADPSLISDDGKTAYDYAVSCGNFDIAAVILEATLPE